MKNKKKYNNDISLDIPMQSGIHDNYKSGLSRNIGTSVHVGYLHKTDDRRHKSRCMHYDKLNKACKCVKCRYYGTGKLCSYLFLYKWGVMVDFGVILVCKWGI